MDDYLSKPVRKGELLERIAKFCGIPEELPSQANEDLVTRFEGDVELLRELSESFAKQSVEMLGQIRHAIVTRDAATLSKTVHTFIGSLGILGADQAVRCARELEQLAKNAAFDESGVVLSELAKEVSGVQCRLAAIC